MGNLANKCIEAYDKMRIFDINKDEQNTENTINFYIKFFKLNILFII